MILHKNEDMFLVVDDQEENKLGEIFLDDGMVCLVEITTSQAKEGRRIIELALTHALMYPGKRQAIVDQAMSELCMLAGMPRVDAKEPLRFDMIPLSWEMFDNGKLSKILGYFATVKHVE